MISPLFMMRLIALIFLQVHFAYFSELHGSMGSADDSFGYSVSIYGDKMAIGATDYHMNSVEVGAAYTFSRATDTGNWSQTSIITSPNLSEADLFGNAVVLSEFFLLIGSPLNDVSSVHDQGSAYVYETAGSSEYILDQILVDLLGAANSSFGWSLAMDDEVAVIGSPGTDQGNGSAYIFLRNPSTGVWVENQILTAGNYTEVNAKFGWSVALYENVLAVSAILQEVGLVEDAGMVFCYLYNVASLTWIMTEALFGDVSAIQYYGYSVAMNNFTLVIGAPFEGSGTNFFQGKVFVYDAASSRSDWVLVTELVAANGGSGDTFGSSVSISGDYIAIGAPGRAIDGKAAQGAVYTYHKEANDQWEIDDYIYAGNGKNLSYFGQAVSVDGAYMAVGSPYATVDGKERAGSVYMYDFVESMDSWIFSCPVGTFVNNNESLCTNCPAGTWSDQISVLECSLCPAGTSTNDETGQSSLSGCVACAKGKYSSETGSSHCEKCDIGKYAEKTGTIHCSDCPVDQTTKKTGQYELSSCEYEMAAIGGILAGAVGMVVIVGGGGYWYVKRKLKPEGKEQLTTPFLPLSDRQSENAAK